MLSGRDILEYLPKVNIVRYLDLYQYENIKDAMGEQGLIILYPVASNNSGHWCCMFNNPIDDKLYFFDSYGYIPDNQLQFKCKSIEWDPDWFRYLTELMYNSGREIEYNEYQFQSMNEGITTCGYWCIARLMFYYLNTEEFKHLFRSGKGIDLDILVEQFCKTKY